MIEVWHNDGDQVLAYRRKNLIFVFNFNPTKSFTDYGFLVPVWAYDVVLNTDATAFGGNGLADDSIRHFTNFDPLYKKDKKEWLNLSACPFGCGIEKSERVIYEQQHFLSL